MLLGFVDSQLVHFPPAEGRLGVSGRLSRYIPRRFGGLRLLILSTHPGELTQVRRIDGFRGVAACPTVWGLSSSVVMWLIGLESDTQVRLLAICSFYIKTNIGNTYLCI